MTAYPVSWHSKYGEMTFRSAEVILARLRQLRAFDSFLEVGCGNAHWSSAAMKLGCSRVHAVDGPWNKPEELLIPSECYETRRIDEQFSVEGTFDLAVCLEVAEHVDQKHAMTLVSALTGASDLVLFAAAIPHQGGYGHINEQWPSWWAEKFMLKGFVPFDIVRPFAWGDDRLHYWYRQNTVLYVRQDSSEKLHDELGRFLNWSADGIVRDLVHPEKYNAFAEHDQVSLGKLAAKLPRHIWGRAKSLLPLGK